MDEMNSNILTFQYSLDDLKQKLETFRRYSPAAIADEIRIAALNSYIENAVIMKDLGILDEEEQDAENNGFEDYYEGALGKRKRNRKALGIKTNIVHRKSGKVLKQFRRVSHFKQSLKANQKNFNRKSFRKLTNTPLTVQTKSPVSIAEVPESMERRDGLEFGEGDTMGADTNGPFNQLFKKERRLHEVVSKHQKKVHKKRQSHKSRRLLQHKSSRVDQQRKLREGDELLELARQGNLFDIDFNSIYDVKDEDIVNVLSIPPNKKTQEQLKGAKI